MIFLPSVLLYSEANVLSSVLSSLTSLVAAVTLFDRIHWKNLVFPLIGCLSSTYFAVSFVKSRDHDTLLGILGFALLVLSIYFFFFSERIKIKPTWYAGLIAGILSGVLSGMFAIGGPPVVLYYMQSEDENDKYMATISAYFVLSGVISIATKAANGFFNANVWWGLAVGVVFMLIGASAGKFFRGKIQPRFLRKAVYALMAGSGIVNLVTALR